MPRDVSGNYTLPAGNPVVSGTVIDTTWANPTLADIVVQLNGVITRDGLLGATSPIGFADGTAANPGIKFNSTPTSGFYTSAVNTVQVSTGGAERFKWTNTATISNVAFGIGVTPDVNTKLQVRATAPAASPVWQTIDTAIFQGTASCLVQCHAGVTGGTLGFDFSVGATRNVGAIHYTTSSNTMIFFAASTPVMNLTSTLVKSLVTFQADGGITVTGGMEVSNNVHFVEVTATGLIANSTADTLVIDSTSNSGISFLGGAATSSQIMFASPTSNNQGGFRYANSSDTLNFRAAGADRAVIDSGGFSVTGDSNASVSHSVAGLKVVGTRRTGWVAATGTATRSTFVTGTVLLPALAEHVKALIDDLIAHGLIGA